MLDSQELQVTGDSLQACRDREGPGRAALTTALAGPPGAVPVAEGFSLRGPGRPVRCLVVVGPVLGVGNPCWGPGLEEGLRVQSHLMTVGKGDRCETL